jgi:hypothetical protein
MSYIGSTFSQQLTTPAVDYFNGNGVTTTFQLTRVVTSVFAIQVVVNNVPQNAREAYGITSSNQIVFTSAPSAGTDNIYVVYDSQVGQTVTPSPGTVGTAQLSTVNSINAGSSSTLQVSNFAGAVTLNVAGTVQTDNLFGRQYTTNGATIDLPIYTEGSWTCLEVIGSVNPNAGGSGSYSDPVHLYVYRGVGFNGSAVTSYIYVVSIAPRARDIFPTGSGISGNIINAFWFNGTTEATTIPVASSSFYVRLRASNYNTSFGSNFQVRVAERY